MKVYSYTAEALTSVVNDGIDVYLAKLEKEGILSKEQAEQLMEYRIVVESKGYFGQTIDKLSNKVEQDELVYRVVRIL